MTIAMPEAGDAATAAPPDDDHVTPLLAGWIFAQQSIHTRRAYARDTDPGLLPLIDPPPPGRKPQSLIRARPPRVPPWREWCRMTGADPVTGVTRNHVNLYARAMEAAGLSPSTRARKLAVISSWYAWLCEDETISVNPAAHVKRPKVDRDTSMTPGLTREQAVALQAAADRARGPHRLRTSALIGILLVSAARVSEITAADIEDLGMSDGHRVLWVTRKGEKRQALVLPPPVTERLDAYLATRPDAERLPAVQGKTGARPRRPLFATGKGERLWRQDVGHLVQRLGKAAGLPEALVAHIGSHALRHTAITFALRSGMPLHDVQDMAGHADPRTTQRYNHARLRLDRSPAYAIAAYLASSEPEE